jgi:hypothetical protein
MVNANARVEIIGGMYDGKRGTVESIGELFTVNLDNGLTIEVYEEEMELL